MAKMALKSAEETGESATGPVPESRVKGAASQKAKSASKQAASPGKAASGRTGKAVSAKKSAARPATLQASRQAVKAVKDNKAVKTKTSFKTSSKTAAKTAAKAKKAAAKVKDVSVKARQTRQTRQKNVRGEIKYLLGIDLGTSATKTVLFDTAGRIIAKASQSYELIQKNNGWAEQEPKDWEDAVLNTIGKVVRLAGVAPEEIGALALSGQMHGLVMLDSKGRVLRPSILWCDARTGAECEEITTLVGARRLIEINANPALPGFTASKILWVRRHEPQIYKKCATILTPKDYVRYRLTGKLAMEISDASGTNLLDLNRRCWSQEILDKLKIDKALLPELVESAAVAGTLTEAVAKKTGLKAGMPVAGGAADNCAAALGTGVCRDGQAFVTLGTSGVIFAHTSKPAVDPLGRVHTFCAAVPGAWTAMSCTLAAGQSLRWLRDECYSAEAREAQQAGTEIYDLMTRQASRIPVGADGLIYLPYLMGERSPVLDPEARGVFFGLSARHSRAHLVRAVLEGVSLSQRDNLHVLQQMGVLPATLTACGGGAASALWRQMLADCLGCRVITTTSTEGGALGAAILAGTACGVFASVEEGCRACVHPGRSQSRPRAQEKSLYDAIYGLYHALYPQLRGAFHRLSALRATLDGQPVAPYPSVHSVQFERFGRVMTDIDVKHAVELLKKTKLPERGVAYEPSVKVLEEPKLKADLEKRVFGGLPIEIGYCSGHNRVLNALEYHRNAELNIAEVDALVMVAPLTSVRGGLVDTREVEVFLVPAGTAVWFYETTLHYAPCTMDGKDYFRMMVVLPRGTNTDRPAKVSRDGEAGMLTHNNKWLLAHPQSPEGRDGITSGRLLGENLNLDGAQAPAPQKSGAGKTAARRKPAAAKASGKKTKTTRKA